MICPSCGAKHNFDMKEIQKGKPWRVKCATCGFNDEEGAFDEKA